MSIETIKKLRAETGAGIQACKEALEQAKGDIDEAVRILKESAQAKSSGTRVASKGLCRIKDIGDEAIVFEVNAETDFAASNPHYLSLLDNLSDMLSRSDAITVKQALSVTEDERSVSTLIDSASSIVSESLALRRFYRIRKQPDQTFGIHIHAGGKVIGLVIVKAASRGLADKLAMHVVAMTPQHVDRLSLDKETLDYERFMLEKTQGPVTDDAFLDHLKSVSLLDQNDIREPSLTVRDVLARENTEVIDFFRIETGQGIENKLNCRLDIPCDGSKITVMPVTST
jgi:elongation factor Ts